MLSFVPFVTMAMLVIPPKPPMPLTEITASGLVVAADRSPLKVPEARTWEPGVGKEAQ